MSKAKNDVSVLNGRVAGVEHFVRAQFEDARELIGSIETNLTKRATEATADLRALLDQIPTKLAAAVGFASQAQLAEIHRELTRIGKKVDALSAKRGAKSSARA